MRDSTSTSSNVSPGGIRLTRGTASTGTTRQGRRRVVYAVLGIVLFGALSQFHMLIPVGFLLNPSNQWRQDSSGMPVISKSESDSNSKVSNSKTDSEGNAKSAIEFSRDAVSQSKKSTNSTDSRKTEKREKRKKGKARLKKREMRKREDKVHDAPVSGDSFSACILWMDDNHRLEEWLAYHYFALNLRYVVLNIDPNSKGSPQSIIDRWNGHDLEGAQKLDSRLNINMTIVTMTDADYLVITNDTKIPSKNLGSGSQAADIDYHHFRQTKFYQACSRHLVERGRTWTSYHDIDEFITFENNSIDHGIQLQ